MLLLEPELDTLRESTLGYESLRNSAAWIDRDGRGKIRMLGDDRVRLLHAMTTNHVQRLQPGQGCYVFFLNAQGRILGDANVLCFEDSLLLDTEPETKQALYEHLDRYIIADDVTLEDQTAGTATIAVEGPSAESVLIHAGAPTPSEPGSWASWDDSVVVRVDSTGAGGYFILTPASRRDAMLRTLDLPEATQAEAHTVRIEHAKPRYGEELTERYLVQETGQLHAVSFSKGCYLGQEIVERVRSRAQIHRTLRALEVASDDPPEVGSKLTHGADDAGEIVSSAYSPALGKSVVMAYLRTPHSEPGTELDCQGHPAIVRH